MGFYAKGSPGAFLHLTEQSDARGGVTEDTIFHSSMPHIFVAEEYESNLNPVRQTGHRTLNEPYYNYLGIGAVERTGQRLPNDYVNTYKHSAIGTVPDKVAQYLKDGNRVVVTVVDYRAPDGSIHSKVVSGHTSKSEVRVKDVQSYPKEGQWIMPRIGCEMELLGNFNDGTDVNVGYSTNTGTYPLELATTGYPRIYSTSGSMGISSVGIQMAAKEWGTTINTEEARRFYSALIYDGIPGFSREWGMEQAYLPLSSMRGLYAKTVLVSCGLDTSGISPGKEGVSMGDPIFGIFGLKTPQNTWATGKGTSMGSSAGRSINYADAIGYSEKCVVTAWLNNIVTGVKHPQGWRASGMDGKDYIPGYQVVTWDDNFPSIPMEWGKGPTPWKYYRDLMIIQGSIHREETTIRGCQLERMIETYGQSGPDYPATNDGKKIITMETPHHTVTYNNCIPVKIRWLVLNLNFNPGNKTYSVTQYFNSNPAAGIKISRNEMSVSGVNFSNMPNWMLYQVNPSKAVAGGRFAGINASYTGVSNVTKPAQPLYGVNSAGNSYVVSGPSEGSYIGANPRGEVLALRKINSGGWFCTPNTIGNQTGAIWSKDSIPLKYINEVTRTVNIPEKAFNPSSNYQTFTLVSGLDLGLAKTRDTTIIVTFSSTDPLFIHMGGLSQNTGGMSGGQPHMRPRSANSLNFQTNHQLLTLPRGRLVPFRIHRNTLGYTNWNWSKEQYAASWEEGVTYFFKNNGNGTVDIVVGYALAESDYRRNVGASVQTAYKRIAISPNRLVRLPAMSMSIHKLS